MSRIEMNSPNLHPNPPISNKPGHLETDSRLHRSLECDVSVIHSFIHSLPMTKYRAEQGRAK